MMAERFGGPFSPGKETLRPSGGTGRPRRMVFRTNLLFVLSAVFALTAFVQDGAGLLLHLVAFGAMLGGAVLTREGLRAEDAFLARTIARAPAIPRKLFGSAATGVAVGLAAADPGAGVVVPALLGLLGAGLHSASFGLDPMRGKGLSDGRGGERVARVVDGADAILDEMQALIRPLGDRRLTDHLSRFVATAREMTRTVEMDPRDLTGARRYLGVYLEGARDATRKFAELYARKPDTEARTEYEALLDDLSATYAARTRRMLEGDRLDLDVEIGVLRDRLAGEAISGRGPDDR